MGTYVQIEETSLFRLVKSNLIYAYSSASCAGVLGLHLTEFYRP